MSKILDQFGREITLERRPPDRTQAVTSIRDRNTGYPSKGMTPQRLGTIFREADGGEVVRQMELFEEMEEKDTHLSSILDKRKRSVAGLDYNIVPFSEDKRDRTVADFIGEVIYNLQDFEDNLYDMLDAIGKGYSALEISWVVQNSKNIIRHLEWIHPKKFTWYNSVTPRLLTETEPINGEDLIPFKFVFHKHKTKSGHPTRQGLLRVAAWMYLFKNYSIKDWVAFAEVYGMPLRLGKYEPSATKDDKDALISALQSLGSDAAGIISSSTMIEFIEGQKYGSVAIYEKLVALCNSEMSKAVLGHSASSDSTPGKLGNESGADDSIQILQKADCETLSKTIRRDLFVPLVGFNFGWDVPVPWFKLDYEDPGDLKAAAERYKVLGEAGLRIGEDHMYEKFNIPKPGKGEAVIQPGAPQGQMLANKQGCPTCLVNKAGDDDELDTVDSLTAQVLENADLGDMIEPIKEILESSDSLEEFKEKLIDAFVGMDQTELGNLLQRALTAAELAGRFEAEEQI